MSKVRGFKSRKQQNVFNSIQSSTCKSTKKRRLDFSLIMSREMFLLSRLQSWELVKRGCQFCLVPDYPTQVESIKLCMCSTGWNLIECCFFFFLNNIILVLIRAYFSTHIGTRDGFGSSSSWLACIYLLVALPYSRFVLLVAIIICPLSARQILGRFLLAGDGHSIPFSTWLTISATSKWHHSMVILSFQVDY